MDKNEVAEFCAEAVEHGYGEYALEALAYWMERKRIDLQMENSEMRNSLHAIHKINRGKDKDIDSLSDMEG